jgi:3-hydroxyisobutyrate dehydrogenase-like beta-hydroxyacid dehydrogenase
MILMMIEAVAEIHVLAEKTGLSNEVMHDAINTLWPGPAGVYSRQMLSGHYYIENVSNGPLTPACLLTRTANGARRYGGEGFRARVELG